MCVGKGREREWGSPFISLTTATDQNTEKQENRYSDKPGARRNFPMGVCPSSVQGGEEVLSVWCCTGQQSDPHGAVSLQGWPPSPSPHCPWDSHTLQCGRGWSVQVGSAWWVQGAFWPENPRGGHVCHPRTVTVLGLLHIHRQCSGSEMPAQIKREMSNLC